MTFLALILKNLWRQRGRTALTLLGIGLGIATVIALGLVSDGLSKNFSAMLDSGKADFTVAQANASDLMFSAIPVSRLDDLRADPSVARVEGLVITATQAPGSPLFVLFGAAARTARLFGIKVQDGRLYREDADELILGKIGARTLHKAMGDTLPLFGREFKVVGIYETGSSIQDGAAILPLPRLQELASYRGKVSLALVKAAPGTDIQRLTAQIERRYRRELVTIKSVEEISRVDKGMDLAKSASWIISVLAVVIGGIGVMNTMMIGVYDRIREIGVLKALGWRRRTVIRLILGEALLLGLVSVLLGSVLAVAALKVVLLFPVARSFIAPAYSLSLWVRATGVALLVALIGGAYPAYRAAGLSPVEALRYE